MESSSLVRCVWTAVRRPLSLCVRVCGCEIVSVCVSRARARVSVVSGSLGLFIHFLVSVSRRIPREQRRLSVCPSSVTIPSSEYQTVKVVCRGAAIFSPRVPGAWCVECR